MPFSISFQSFKCQVADQRSASQRGGESQPVSAGFRIAQPPAWHGQRRGLTSCIPDAHLFSNHETCRLPSLFTSISHRDTDTGPSVPTDVSFGEGSRRKPEGDRQAFFCASSANGREMVTPRSELARAPKPIPTKTGAFPHLLLMLNSILMPTPPSTHLFTTSHQLELHSPGHVWIPTNLEGPEMRRGP